MPPLNIRQHIDTVVRYLAHEPDHGITFGGPGCDTLSLAQAPWGRTTGGEFHARLAAGWHCVLRLELPRWPLHRDTLSVWRRTTADVPAPR